MLSKHGYAVALIGYRLSLAKGPPESQEYTNPHPAHLKDVFRAMQHLLVDRPQGRECGYDASKAVLAGHSVGAWMVAAVMLRSESDGRPLSGKPIPPLGRHVNEARKIRLAIRAFVLLDGIYNLDSLLNEYPSYEDFVAQAIPIREDRHLLTSASVTSWTLAPQSEYVNGGPHVYLLHSPDDELLTYEQSVEMSSYLCKSLVDASVISYEQVQRGRVPGKTIGKAGLGDGERTVESCKPYVNVNFTTLKVSEHKHDRSEAHSCSRNSTPSSLCSIPKLTRGVMTVCCENPPFSSICVNLWLRSARYKI